MLSFRGGFCAWLMLLGKLFDSAAHWEVVLFILLEGNGMSFSLSITYNSCSQNTFLAFLAVFELGSLLCGLSPSSNLFIFGRAVAGIGAAGLVNGCLTILSSAAPLEKRPLFISSIVSVSTIGSITGPLVGGVLTDGTNWRWCTSAYFPFYISQ